MESSTLVWKAQPLEKGVPLRRLVSFYERLGGEVVAKLDARCVQMQLSDATIVVARDFVMTHAECVLDSGTAADPVISMLADVQLSMKNFQIATRVCCDGRVAGFRGSFPEKENVEQ